MLNVLGSLFATVVGTTPAAPPSRIEAIFGGPV